MSKRDIDYTFDSINPAYNEVQNKISEFKKQGWTNIEFHPGHEQTFMCDGYKAKLTGVIKCNKKDTLQFIKEYTRGIAKDEREIRNLKAELNGNIKYVAKTIAYIRKDILKSKNIIKKLKKELK